MENTLANKAKFFAQYWGQKVRCWDTGSPEELGVVGSTFIVKPYLIKTHLLLKPLSSITDEDAEEAGISNKRLKQHILFPHIMTPLMSEILKSKGYALPYMGLSVEKLIEYGWVKLS